MKTRIQLENKEINELCIFATLSKNSKGRRFQEEKDPYRTCFLRDRDRLLHSGAFRRLQQKTQVLCVWEGDYFRTRLTHTMEVFQMAQSAGTALELNSDLCQAIAIGHDIGHPPFGHAGENALAEVMKDFGGFSHNAHAAHLVDHLERRNSNYPGLNLTFEVRRSFLKKRPPHGFPIEQDLLDSIEQRPPIEAELVDLLDEIAYLHHDLDDALRIGLIEIKDASELSLWKLAASSLKKDPTPQEVITRMIKIANQDLIEETGKRIKKGLEEKQKPYPGNSSQIKSALEELRRFLFSGFYKNQKVLDAMEEAKTLLKSLFYKYLNSPNHLPQPFQELRKQWGLERTVCDYIAGMTDRFVCKLTGKAPKIIN